MTEHRSNIVSRVLDWLREGYPQGVPTGDYVALLGIMQRRLTPLEVEKVAQVVAAESGSDADEQRVREAIGRLVLETPLEEDVRRVQSRLAAGGWPLATPLEVVTDASDTESTPDSPGDAEGTQTA